MPDTIPQADIEAAYQRIQNHIRRTPIMTLAGRELGQQEDVVLKLECLQHAGSFKARGAFNSLVGADVPSAGVVAASGGNHGAAVAYAASTLGHDANIFVPEISSPAKIDLIRACGAEVHVGGARYADALAASLEPEAAEVTMRPSTNVSLDVEDAKRMVRLLDMLEDLDDVQQVYSNADISEETLAQLD